MKLQPVAIRLLLRIGSVERVVTFAAFLVLIGVIFADVLMREVTGSGLHWARQAGVYANLFVVMFGIGIASASGAHLRPRFADGWLPARFEPLLIRLQDALMACFCLCFAVVAAIVVMDSYMLAERSVVLRILIWPFQAVVPVVFVIATVRHGLFAAFPSARPAEPAGAIPVDETIVVPADNGHARSVDQGVGGDEH
jgi:TRAP-type C4-dicarboxylate transport system permease small subunit